MNRIVTPLNNKWEFYAHHNFMDKTKEINTNTCQIVDLPHNVVEVPLQYFHEAEFEMIASYRKVFEVPCLRDNQRFLLICYGIAVSSQIYLNQQLVGSTDSPYTPTKVDITSAIKEGDNELVIVVDTHETPNIPPFGGVIDYLVYGGIYREVELLIVPNNAIKSVQIRPYDGELFDATSMGLDVIVEVDKADAGQRVLSELYDGDNLLYSLNQWDQEANLYHAYELVSQIERWSLDHPKLYTIKTTLYQDDQIIDETTQRFGFRTIAFTHEGFVLNNQKIKLIGLNRHQSYAYMGNAAPKRLQEKDAEILKFDLGCNIVRCAHYMQSDHFINRCDEIGLLVFEEIPGWQHIGDESFQNRSLINLETMIRHHFNHPSICIWGVRINESSDHHDFYTLTNELAKKLDNTRPTGGVRNFPGSELLEDVYTYNDFSHDGTNLGLSKPRKITKTLVPYLVTESNGHMYPTKRYDHEERRLEQAHRHLMVHDASFSYPFLAGAISWCMSDYHTHIQFGSGDRICYHGVLDLFRIPKYAASVYASQQSVQPVLEVASSMLIGDYDKGVLPPTFVFTNCDMVKVYKDDELIDTFYGDWERYPHIPNPPIVIDDMIASRILENEDLTPKVAGLVKSVLLAFIKDGMKLNFKAKIQLARLLLFHKMKISTLMDYYGKYIGSWGKEGSRYRFEGYLNDELVLIKERGSSKSYSIKIQPDDTTLQRGNTYDATRIVISFVDEFDQVVPYAFDSFQIKTSNHLRVIGPKQQTLLGGAIGVYVRTMDEIGEGEVRFHFERYGEFIVKIEVK